jgi:hypothetical protein
MQIATGENKRAAPVSGTERTVADLLADVRAAGERMSRRNAHRRVLVEVERALIQLAQRVVDLQARVDSLESL